MLKVEDPVLAAIATQLEAEAIQGGLGGTLYTDALRNQARHPYPAQLR